MCGSLCACRRCKWKSPHASTVLEAWVHRLRLCMHVTCSHMRRCTAVRFVRVAAARVDFFAGKSSCPSANKLDFLAHPLLFVRPLPVPWKRLLVSQGS